MKKAMKFNSQINDLGHDRNAFAKQQQAAGKKVVGYLSCNIPVEIIHASGAIPLHLSGNANQSPDLANEFMEAAFDPMTRSVFDRLLKGEYDFLDLIVLPRCNDSHQRLYYYIREIHRKYPQYSLPPVYLVDLLHTPWPSSEKRNVGKFQAFKQYLETLFGITITNEALNKSIEDYTESRTLLNSMYQLQASTNEFIDAENIYAVHACAQSASVELLVKTLRESLSEWKTTTKQASRSPRIILAGNGLDHPGLHQAISAMNANIVGEYHSLGHHFLCGSISENPHSPIEAIAKHYHRQTISSRTFSPDPQDVVQFAQQQNADAIVFYFLQGEEALTWQVPAQKHCAEAAGIGSISFYDQTYSVDIETLYKELAPFINRYREN